MNWAEFENETNRFANVEWDSRWNKATQTACLDQDANSVMLTTSIGVIKLDLEDSESVTFFISHMRAALDMLEDTLTCYQESFDGVEK